MTHATASRRPHPILTHLLRLAALGNFTLSGACAVAKPYQPVTRLTCPGGEFIVDARP